MVWSLGCMTAPLSMNRALLKAWGCPDITPRPFFVDFTWLFLCKPAAAVALLAIHGGQLCAESLEHLHSFAILSGVLVRSLVMVDWGARVWDWMFTSATTTPPLPLSYFSLHLFSLETNHAILKAKPGCLLTRCGVTHVWHHVLATKSCYSWSCTVPYGVVCSLNNHCSYS